MRSESYTARRGQLQTYFDRTAADAWAKLTSTAKVSRVRETVRAGRDRMRATLLGWLPLDLRGARLLDAGCGTGALAVEAARRGARVLGIDLSPTLLDHARERLPTDLGEGSVDLRPGDMLDAAAGEFDHVVAMDSLIHYRLDDILDALGALAPRTSRSIVFTFAPSNPLLEVFWFVGKMFPRGDRAPAIAPVSESALRHGIASRPALQGWSVGRSERIRSGFYTSHALELLRR